MGYKMEYRFICIYTFIIMHKHIASMLLSKTNNLDRVKDKPISPFFLGGVPEKFQILHMASSDISISHVLSCFDA